MRSKHWFLSFVAITAFIYGCSKLGMAPSDPIQQSKKTDLSGARLLTSGYCYSCGIIDSMPTIDHGGDSIERPTVLGMKHVNPYLLPNVQQAYNNLGLNTITATVNNLYVRFLPSSGQQLATLDSIMNIQGLELFDTPMDYDVLQEGDYYQDPAIPLEQVTYQYAVVPPGFQFPAGISYNILAQIHIPDDNYTAVETEAERLAGIQDSINGGGFARVGGAKPNVLPCDPGCHWDFVLKRCVCDPTCPPGFQWNGTACVPIPPPPPATDAAIPAGNILVHDYNIGTDIGVRTLRVIVKRWFKIQRLYTDNSGHFAATKRFKHKVKVSVKFTNDFASIKGVRGIRLWQMYFPIAHTQGVYSGNKSNIQYLYTHNPGSGSNYTNSKGNRYWVACTVTNAIQEHRDYATQFNFSPAPMGMSIMLTNWGISSGTASCPLFNKRSTSVGLNNDFITVFVGNGGGITPFNIPNMDIIMDYHIDNNSGQLFSSDFIKTTIYHELSHASQYVQVGNTWYGNFVASIVAEMGHAITIHNNNISPYGDGTSAASPIIAVGEAWGYHMGLFLANQKFNVENGLKGDGNVSSQKFGIQGQDGAALENFNPVLPGDPFAWIPKGLMLDLMDNTPGEAIVVDQVNGYTIQQIFGALQSDVVSVSQYKAKLLLLYGNAQQVQVNNLFASYHY